MTNLYHDVILTNEDAYIIDEQVKVLYRECNIYYRACVGSVIYLFYTRVDLCFAVQKQEIFHQIPVKYILRVWYTC